MFLTPLACGYSTTRANAKHHIVNHLVCDAFVWDARFQDAHVANSDTNARRMGWSERSLVPIGIGTRPPRRARRQQSGLLGPPAAGRAGGCTFPAVSTM